MTDPLPEHTSDPDDRGPLSPLPDSAYPDDAVPLDEVSEDDDLDDSALDVDPVEDGGPPAPQRGGNQDPDGTR